MDIKVKNISVNLANSEETHCFSAVVHVDGKKAFAVRNQGHGGGDIVDRIPGYAGPDERAVDQWLKDNRPADTSHGITIEHSLEIEVSDQVNAFLKKKEQAKTDRQLDKMLAEKIVGIKDGSLFVWKNMPTPANLARLRASKPGYDFVNDGGPEGRAKALKAFCPNYDE